MIEIRDLTKYYGERRALGPVTLSIAEGEVVGLLGLNGAGKTTTLRILACDLLPSSGTVLVDGLDVVERPHEVRQRVGYLPDVPPLYPDMTVRAFLSFAAELRDVPRRDVPRLVGKSLEATDLVHVADEEISALSHGFRQRVGIAQAIVHEPRFLVLDEPISGLDPVQIVEMRALLRQLAGAHTILVSSHILSEISETCQRILVIRDGLIAATGTEDELRRRMTGAVRVEALVRGDEAEVSRLATDLASGIDGAAEPSVSPEGDHLVRIVFEAPTDAREALSKTIVQGGLGLLELRRADRELESVFLELAREPDSRPARGAALSRAAHTGDDA